MSIGSEPPVSTDLLNKEKTALVAEIDYSDLADQWQGEEVYARILLPDSFRKMETHPSEPNRNLPPVAENEVLFNI